MSVWPAWRQKTHGQRAVGSRSASSSGRPARASRRSRWRWRSASARDSQRRLAAVLSRDGSRHGETVGRRSRARVPHHLIDVRNPDQSLDVAEFAQLARAAIAEIAARGRNPLVVGGSGLYLRVMRGGIFSGPAASLEIRDRAGEGRGGTRRRASASMQLREIDPRGGGSNRRQRFVPHRAGARGFRADRRNDLGASAAASVRRHRLRYVDCRRRSRAQETLRGYRPALRRDGRGGAGRGSARA